MKNALGLNPNQIITAAREKKSCQARLMSLSVSFIYSLIAFIYLCFCWRVRNLSSPPPFHLGPLFSLLGF